MSEPERKDECLEAQFLSQDYHCAVAEVRKAILCLYMEASGCVVDDVSKKIETVLQAAQQQENYWKTRYMLLKEKSPQAVSVSPEIEAIIDAARRSLGDPYDPLTIVAKFDLSDAVKAYDTEGKV